MGGGRKKACDICHARKIHCDGALPSCDWCSHQGLLCTFDRSTRASVARRSRNTRITRDTACEKPVRVVDALSSTLLPPTPSSMDVLVPVAVSSPLGSSSHQCYSPPTSIPQNHSSSYIFSLPESQNRAWGKSPFFSTEDSYWIPRTGESALLDLLSPIPIGTPWQREHQRSHHSPAMSVETIVADLPAKAIAEQYLQLFRSTSFRLVFPIVDTVLFQATINSAYEPGDSSMSSSACVFSFLSIMSHTQWTPNSSAAVDGNVCARQATLRMELVTSEVTIDGLQFCVMQCMYQLFSGNLQVSIMYHAIACRTLFILGGHVCTQPISQDSRTPGRIDRERRTKVQLRKLFWLCYTFDKVLALRTGQPSCIDDELCDLTLPPGYADMLYSEGDFDAAPSTTLCLFPGDLRLSIIKSRICKLLYSIQAHKLSNSELLRIVRELDGELEKWRVSIPLEYRPTLSCGDNSHGFDPAMDSTQKMHIIIIHLEYHHVMGTIHWTASQGFAWEGGNSTTLVNQGLGISSSLVLSVKASRASLEYLRVAAHALMVPTFWVIVFYPLNAILTIFKNTLLNPLQPQAEYDINLLEFTAILIKQIRSQRYIPIDNLDISRIDNFVSEVIRLAKCAIVTARKERDDINILCDTA